MKFNFLLFCIFSCAFITCIQPPEYPIEPRIEFVSLSKDRVLSAIIKERDSFFVTLSFTDGDGDIGLSPIDTNVYIFDSRQKSVRINDVQGLPAVPEAGSKNGITGEIKLRLLGPCCRTIDGSCAGTPKSPTDTTSYEIYIKDRAGNKSNTLTTPPLYITCRQ